MKKIEDYLKNASEHKSIMSINEIEDTLILKTKKSRSNTDFTLHRIFQFIHENKLKLTLTTMLLTIIVSLFTIQDSIHQDQNIYIPESQQRIIQLVSLLNENKNKSIIKVSHFGNEANEKSNNIPIHMRSKIELPNDKLKQLGIFMDDEKIIYEGNVVGSGYLKFEVRKENYPKGYGSTSVTVDRYKQSSITEYTFYPWFLTDLNGKQSVRYSFDNEAELKMTDDFFLSTLDQLIPIQVSLKGFYPVIFWFSSSPELIKILESESKASEKTISENKSYEKSSLSMEIEVFPTLLKTEVNIHANFRVKQPFEVLLLNPSGEIIQTIVKNQIMVAGEHNFSMDVSTLQSGLYFIRVQSENGRITFHRVFKE